MECRRKKQKEERKGCAKLCECCGAQLKNRVKGCAELWNAAKRREEMEKNNMEPKGSPKKLCRAAHAVEHS